MRRASSGVVTALACAVLAHGAPASAADWPQWRGPQRDGVSAETGLLRSWPAGGPKLAWQTPGLGTGYSSVVISRGRVFSMGRQEADVVVTALEEATGKPHWTRTIGNTSRIPGSTPTADGDRLYALDPDGDLCCLKSDTGEIVWRKNYVDDFGGRMMSGRGFGESPLVDGEKLICTPGGAEAAFVALDKRTGEVLWKSKLPAIGPAGRDGAGFSSVVVTEAAGVRQYVQLVGRGVVGIDARDGRFLWAHNAIANDTANIPTPVVRGDMVFAANGYTAGSVLLKLVPAGDPDAGEKGVKAEVVYSLVGSQFQNHHGGVVRVGEFLFAGHGNNNGLPTCLELATGRVAWKRRGPGVGSAAVTCADGRLYFRYQNGVVALLDATDSGYNLRGTLEVPGAGGDSWAHPVVANGRLYLREQDVLWAYDVRREGEAAASVAEEGGAPDPALETLRRLGARIEALSAAPRAGAASAKGTKDRRLSEFLFGAEEQGPTTIPFATLGEKHVAADGTLSDEVLNPLAQVRGPLMLSLAGTRLSDAGLAQLARLERLAGLDLELCTRLTDAGLKPLPQLKRLRVLVLAGTGVTAEGLRLLAPAATLAALDLELCDGITDAACEPLAQMKHLRAIVFKKSGFEKNRISDAGLERLKGLAGLEALNLYGNAVTDAGLAHLEGMTKLRELNLSLLPLSDAGLIRLKPLESLQRLDLLFSEGFAGPKITDRGMESLLPLSKLAVLDLTAAQLTNAGLERLQALKGLRSLQLVRTRVTADGVRAFQSALPDCDIAR